MFLFLFIVSSLLDHGAKKDLDPESHDEGSGRPWMREHDDEKFVEINDGEGGCMESPESLTVLTLKPCSCVHVQNRNNFSMLPMVTHVHFTKTR